MDGVAFQRRPQEKSLNLVLCSKRQHALPEVDARAATDRRPASGGRGILMSFFLPAEDLRIVFSFFFFDWEGFCVGSWDLWNC